MKVIILAAGQGTRLRPYTNDRPKCMVELHGTPLLHRQLDTMEKCGISLTDISLVGGYLQERLVAPGIKQFTNSRYAETNMVETLFSAEEFMAEGEDLIIAYGDIIYDTQVLNALLETDGDLVLTADEEWQKLWSLRMENPLDDVETFKMNKDGYLVELGKPPESLEDVQAQYMGLIKVRGGKVKEFIDFYYSLDRNAFFDGKDFANMYMTSFIQSLIENEWRVKPALIKSGWLEVDTADELQMYASLGLFK